MAQIFLPPSRALDANGVVMSGAKWYFYETGGTTPANTYTSSALSTPNANPVVADSGGKFGPIYLDPAVTYRGVLKDSTGATTIHDFDPISITTQASSLGFTQAGASAVARTVQSKLEEHVSILDFRAVGATTDTAAYLAAVATGKPVYFPAGEGTGTNGVYQISTANGTSNVPSGATLFGDGMGKTIIMKPSGATGFHFFIDSGSATISNNLRGITFRDMTIEDTGGFSGQQHEIWLGGVTDFLAERVEFKQFRGDGLYVGSGNNSGSTTERHNLNVTVRDCFFNGVDNDNRNGISVIDCDGLTIDNCRFYKVSKLDGSQPGPIDVEPDASVFHICRNIKAINCIFEDCGGTVFSILVRPNSYPTYPYEHFSMSNCQIIDCYQGFSMYGYATTAAATSVAPYHFSIDNCHFDGLTQRIGILQGAHDARVTNCLFADSKAIWLGDDAVTNRALEFVGNTFVRCGTEGYLFFQKSTLTDARIENNRFIDCGKTDGTQGWIYYLQGAAANVTDLRLNFNIVTNPNTKTTAFARQVGGYAGTIDAASTKIGNVLPSLGTADNLTLGGTGYDLLRGSATADIGNITAGLAGTTTVTVTGAAVGDFVESVSGSTALEAGLYYAGGEVTAANTVTIALLNPTAGAIDPASRTYYVTVRKRTA